MHAEMLIKHDPPSLGNAGTNATCFGMTAAIASARQWATDKTKARAVESAW